MNRAKFFLDFYINSSIHVALGVVALTGVTALHFDLVQDPVLLSFVLFGTITGYNFVKYAGIAKLHHRSLTKNLKLIQIFSFLCFIALLFLSFKVEFEVLIIAGALGFFTMLYALPVFRRRKNLREISGLKVFVIAFIWAGVTVFFPLADAGQSFIWDVVLEFFQRFLFVLILILPFEIRDLKYDKLGLKTIPQRLGVPFTRYLGLLLIVVWVMLEFLKGVSTPDSQIAIACTAVITGSVLLRAREDQALYFSSFWVEGIPHIWFLLLLLLKLI